MMDGYLQGIYYVCLYLIALTFIVVSRAGASHSSRPRQVRLRAGRGGVWACVPRHPGRRVGSALAGGGEYS